MVCSGVIGNEGRCGPGQGSSGTGVDDLRASKRRLPLLLLLLPMVVLVVMQPLLLPLLLPCTPCGLARHIRTHLRRHNMISAADGATWQCNKAMSASHLIRANLRLDVGIFQ